MTNAADGSLRMAHLRIARPTDRLAEVAAFYRDALGFEVLGSFRGHAGFDGVMLGHEAAGYHLEFTSNSDHPAGAAPSPDHLLVFYLPDQREWQAAIDRLERHGCRSVVALNPYWDQRGRTYADPDGYRIVIQQAPWPAGNSNSD